MSSTCLRSLVLLPRIHCVVQAKPESHSPFPPPHPPFPVAGTGNTGRQGQADQLAGCDVREKDPDGSELFSFCGSVSVSCRYWMERWVLVAARFAVV